MDTLGDGYMTKPVWDWGDVTPVKYPNYWSAGTYPRISDGESPKGVCVLVVAGQFYVSPTGVSNNSQDVGPYATVEEAQLAAEMLVSQGVLP